MRAIRWLVVSIALAAAGARAEPAAGEESVQCISHWPVWEASADEVAAIETAPIPRSFRIWADDVQACTRFRYVTMTLIDWHLAFGSETSTAAALAYLEREQLRGLPRPEAYPRALERAWRSALPDLRRALSDRQPSNLDRADQHVLMRSAPSLRELSDLVEAQERFLLLAEQESRAAEDFDSLSLLARGQRHFRAAEEGAAFLGALQTDPLGRHFDFDLEPLRIHEIRLRDALLRARLTGAAADRERAEALVNGDERPAYRELVGPAFSGGSDFCDIDNINGNAAELRALCRTDEQMHERAVSWAVAHAMLLLLRGDPDEDEDAFVESVLYLLDREMDAVAGRCCRLRSGEDSLRLHVYRSEQRRSRFETTTDFSRARHHWILALSDLSRAASLVSPAASPARWKRIVEPWLEVWALGEGRAPPAEDMALTASQDLQRYATYLRTVLAALPSIATGADSGLQAR